MLERQSRAVLLNEANDATVKDPGGRSARLRWLCDWPTYTRAHQGE